MKIEITSQVEVSGWNTPIIIITQNEYLKADLTEINYVVEMLCNSNCFERQLTNIENAEILKIFNEFKKGCKVFLGISSNSRNTKRHLEIAVLTSLNKLLQVSQYDEKTDSCYIVQRDFKKND